MAVLIEQDMLPRLRWEGELPMDPRQLLLTQMLLARRREERVEPEDRNRGQPLSGRAGGRAAPVRSIMPRVVRLLMATPVRESAGRLPRRVRGDLAVANEEQRGLPGCA
jgi:hypothetical protein